MPATSKTEKSVWLYTLFRKLCREVHFNPLEFVFPLTLSWLASTIASVTPAMMIPLFTGFLTTDFSEVRKLLTRLTLQAQGLDNQRLVILFLAVVVFVSLGRHMLSFSGRWLGMKANLKFSQKVRLKILERILSFNKITLDQTSQGHLNYLITKATQRPGTAFGTFRSTLNNIFIGVSYFTLMVCVSWKLTLLCMTFVPLLVWLNEKAVALTRNMSQSALELNRRLNLEVHNAVSSIPLIKLAAGEHVTQNKIREISQAQNEISLRQAHQSEVIALLRQGSSFLIFIIVVLLMLRQIQIEGMTLAASYIVFLHSVKKLFDSIHGLLIARVQMASLGAPLNELLEVFNDSGKVFDIGGKQLCPPLKREIEIRNLSFAYVPQNKVLRNVNLSIEKGKVTALVGATGGGKSTLVHLLVNLYRPTQGTIFFDGVDIHEFTLPSLRNSFAVVTQDCYLFNDTVRNNLAFPLEDVSEDRLWNALRLACLDSLVRKLPEQLDTIIGDKGVKLSGGEKQRLSIARAFLKSPEILIFDECTSSLDVKTEAQIQEAAQLVLRGRTGIVIAHRLTTIRNADRVIVLENGEVLEGGSLASLLKKEGQFSSYWSKSGLPLQ